MAEKEKDKEPEPAPAPASGGGMKMILIPVAASLISVVGALAVFYVFFMPKLSGASAGEHGEEDAEEEIAVEEGGGGHGGGHGESKGPTSLTIDFEEALATLIMPSPDMPASVLSYQVSVTCSNQTARTLIEANKSRFVAKFRELHSYKKREEVDNPQLEQDIVKAIVQESNALLQEIMGKPSEKTRVVSAYHTKFFVQDF